MMADKKYRFFFHYRKQTKRLTLHYRDECIGVDDIDCRVSCETKWNKNQPHLVMRGFSKSVTYYEEGDRVKAVIE